MHVTTVRLGGRPHQPLLLLGPSAGTSVQALWGAAARELSQDFQVVGWDLPGHGTNPRFDAADPRSLELGLRTLSRGLLDALDRLLDTAPGVTPTPVHLAGHGVGAAVGLLLAAAHPRRVETLTLLGRWREPAGPDHDDPPTPADPDAVAAVRRAHLGVDDLQALVEELSTPPLDAPVDPVAEPERVAALVRDHARGLDQRDDDHGAGSRALDARTEALVHLALAAATTGAGALEGADTVVDQLLGACRTASRHGATQDAIRRTVSLAWGSEDAEGHRVSALLTRLGSTQ